MVAAALVILRRAGSGGNCDNRATGGQTIGLTGGLGPDFNQSTSGTGHYAIFGDMNQQGAADCPL
jgi:hypothetical protein